MGKRSEGRKVWELAIRDWEVFGSTDSVVMMANLAGSLVF